MPIGHHLSPVDHATISTLPKPRLPSCSRYIFFLLYFLPFISSFPFLFYFLFLPVRLDSVRCGGVLDLMSLPYPRLPDLLFPRLIPTLFSSYSACIILIDYFHPSCLVSALLSTGYGPRRCKTIDYFSRKIAIIIVRPCDSHIVYSSDVDFSPSVSDCTVEPFCFQPYLEFQSARNPIAIRHPDNRNPIVT